MGYKGWGWGRSSAPVPATELIFLLTGRVEQHLHPPTYSSTADQFEVRADTKSEWSLIGCQRKMLPRLPLLAANHFALCSMAVQRKGEGRGGLEIYFILLFISFIN